MGDGDFIVEMVWNLCTGAVITNPAFFPFFFSFQRWDIYGSVLSDICELKGIKV